MNYSIAHDYSPFHFDLDLDLTLDLEWVLLERSSIVEFKYLKSFVIRGHWRSPEVNKGQKSKIKKVYTMGIVGKVFNCRIQIASLLWNKV